ncbi:MAG: glycosyltransferase [Tepidisphaeraceae bacterium]
MTDNSPLKICFIAFCCEPGRGSEWGLGWSYVQEISRTQPVWVVVHDECRPALDKYLAEQHTGHPIYPTYVSMPAYLRWMKDSWYSLFNVYYYLWQFAAGKALRRLHDRVQLDLVQHVSLCRWWMPSAGAAIASRGAAFIFGPVGGGELLPSKFRDRVPVMGKVADALRWIGRTICRRDPFLVKTIRSADLLVAAIPPVKPWFAKYVSDEVELDCASCCSAPDVLRGATFARETRSTHGPFTFASCGGLSYFRGVDLAIRAFAKADIPNSRYVHACDGPMRPALEELAKELGVSGRVIFLGDIPHSECVKAMVSADVGVHTVLRDSAGVLPDALYAGLPFITLDHLTPSMLVTPECAS